MKSNYTSFADAKKICKYLLFLSLISLIFYGCFKLKSIDHPTTAETNSYFEVTFVCEPDVGIKTEAQGFVGALLPKGWRVQDYTDYTIFFPDEKDNKRGRFSYDQYYTARLESNYETPEGYYWWGGRSIDDIELINSNGVKCKDFSFKLRIYTDNKTGDFNLKYVIGTNGNNENKDFVNESRSITITQGNKFPLKKEANWELLPNRGWDTSIKFYSDKDYDGFFRRWYGWNGGDIGVSAPLGDGRSIWVWGDSHTGKVISDRTRLSDQAQFERNFIMLQDGEDFSAFKLLNQGSPDGSPNGKIKEMLIPTDDGGNPLGKSDVWYWPNGSSVYYRNGVPELQMVLSRMEKAGEGMWGMTGVAADVAVFSLPDMKLKQIVKNMHVMKNMPIGYAGQVFKDDDGVVYVYGQGSFGICATYTFAARVPDGDLTKGWEFYNAKTKTWSKDISWQKGDNWKEGAIAEHPLFVFKDGGKYFAFNLPPCFGSDIFICDSETPYGPFTNRRKVGQLPDEITKGYVTTLPGVHQQHSKNGELLFSVSKNYDNNARKEQGLPELQWYNVPGCADEYIPYFFRVKNWRGKLNISDKMDATDNKGILTAQYDENIENLTDNSEKTIYSASAGSAWIQYQSPSPINLRRYTITSANDNPEKDLLHWRISASNDGIKWTVLDERYYAEFDERLQTNNYEVSIDGKFTHFRFDILASKGGQELQMAEWQMFGKFDYKIGSVAELEEVIVNGKSVSVEDVMTIDLLPMEETEIQVSLKTKDHGTLDGVKDNFKVISDNAGIKKYIMKVKSEDGNSEKEYQLILKRWFAFDEVVKVKWNNTLMLYLDKLKDYNISGYQWYKDNNQISGATGKTYSAGSKKTDLLDMNSTYYVALETPEGVLRSEAKSITMNSSEVKIYPNPIKSGEAVTITTDFEDDLLTNATIGVYNVQGYKISSAKVQGHSTTMSMPFAAGIYFLKLTTGNGFEKTLKVIVK